LASCVSPQKVIYFQSAAPDADSLPLVIRKQVELTIRKGDLLSIYATSLNPEATAFFNPLAQITSANISAAGGFQGGQFAQLPTVTGYLVDGKGEIELPLVGRFMVDGMTTSQIRDAIRTKLERYLKEPTVTVRMLNFRVSVLGEVARPSVYSIPNERITLPEAISLAGDVTIYGERQNVLLVREIGDKREFVRVDLTKRDLFTSPYYFLQPNDIIYIQPVKTRQAAQDRFLQITPLAISALSFLAIITGQFLR